MRGSACRWRIDKNPNIFTVLLKKCIFNKVKKINKYLTSYVKYF